MKRARTTMLSALIACVAMTATSVEVTDVVAKQRYPWNGLVDITCNVTGINGTTNRLEFAVSMVNQDTGEIRNVSNFWAVRNGTKSNDIGVYTNGSYRILWHAKADIGSGLYSNIVVRVTTIKGHGRVQLWEGGPYWSEMNIGAKNPEDYGYYFWWGDTVGQAINRWAYNPVESPLPAFSRPFSSSNTPTYGKNLSTLQSEGWIVPTNDTYVLAPEHDAAHVHWGGKWRMPTIVEFYALRSNCDWTWTTQNGVSGYIVRGRDAFAVNSIFLPAAGHGYGTSVDRTGSEGHYYSSSPDSDFYFEYWGYYTKSNQRYEGQPVRPVQGFAE